jgi:hypothetical protein
MRAGVKDGAPFDRAHAVHWLGNQIELLDASERKALDHVLRRRPANQEPPPHLTAPATPGQRVADAVARVGGSWRFIGFFLLALASMLEKQEEQIKLLTRLLARTGLSQDA